MHAVNTGIKTLLLLAMVGSSQLASAQIPSERRGTQGVVTANGQTGRDAQQSGGIRLVAQRGGILGRVFGGGGGGAASGGAKKDDDGRRVIEPVIPDEPPNWEGVPFHKAAPTLSAKGDAPLKDPRDPSNTRVAPLRDLQSSASAPSSEPASRVASRTPRGQVERPSMSQIPVPPTEAELARSRAATPPSLESYSSTTAPDTSLETSRFQPLSSTESSRRSRRRTIEPLDIAATETARTETPRGEASASNAAPAAPSTRSQVSNDAAPRVNRTRPTTSTTANSAASQRRGWTTSSNTQDTASTEGTSANQSANRSSTQSTEIAWRPAPGSQTSKPANTASTTATSSTAATPGVARSTSESDSQTVSQQVAAPAAQSGTLETPSSLESNLAETSNTAVPGPESNVASSTAAAVPAGAPAAPTAQTPALTSTAPTATNTAPAATSADLDVTPHTAPPANSRATAAVNDTPLNLSSEIPGIRVVTTGPRDIAVRQTTIYQIAVENLGTQNAPGAAIQIKLPNFVAVQNLVPSRGELARENGEDSKQLLWVVEGLPGGKRDTLALHLAAEKAEGFDVDVEWAVVPQTSSARIAVREPKLQLAIDGPEEVIYGQSATYTVRVINPGNGPAENVMFTLSPNSATPQTQKVARIEAGGEATFEVELTARDLENLQIHGLATADLNLKQEQIKTIEVIAARLQAVLSGPPLKYQDALAEYNVELANTGSALCENISAAIELPPGVLYQGGIEGATQDGNQLRWQIAKLAPGEKQSFTLRCQMRGTGDQQLRFVTRGSAAGAAEVAFSTQVEALADLVLSINDPPAPAPVDDEVTYEIVIRNRGSKAASGVVAIAQFSHDIEPVRIEGAQGTIAPGQVKFDQIPNLPAGQTVRIRVIAKADKAGLHRFRTEVQSGDTVLVAEEATRYMELAGKRVSRSSEENSSELQR